MGRTECVLPFRGLEVQGRGADCFAVGGSAGGPVLLDWGPEVFAKAFDVSVSVLRDQGCDCFWTFESQAKGCWRTVIEDVDGEFFDGEGVQER